MGIVTEKYVRKPLYVEAVRVTQDNFSEMVDWVKGDVQFEETRQGSSRKYIWVEVHNPHPNNDRQNKAFVGDWVLKTERGFKIYTNKAFKASFEKVVTEAERVTTSPQGDSGAQPAASHEFEVKEVSAVAADPTPGSGVGPIVSVEQPSVEPEPGQPAVTDSPTAPPPVHDGKVVITENEARNLTRDQVEGMLRTGEYVLYSDLAA